MTAHAFDPGLLAAAREDLRELAAAFHARGWCPATSGNFSVVLADDPLVLLITRSGRPKQRLGDDDFLLVDAAGSPLEPTAGRPSAETALHCAIAVTTGAECVLHTHSVANTLLGERHLGAGGFTIEGYELLKALHGVETHDAALFVPVLPNSQDMPAFAGRVRALLERDAPVRGFLIAGHGLYTWGRTLPEARRHVEAFEFLLECVARRTRFEPPGA